MQLFDTKKTWQLFLRGLQNIRTWWRQKGLASYYMIWRSDILHDLRYSMFWSGKICAVFASSCKKNKNSLICFQRCVRDHIEHIEKRNVELVFGLWSNQGRWTTGVLSQHNGGGIWIRVWIYQWIYLQPRCELWVEASSYCSSVSFDEGGGDGDGDWDEQK